jgi:hypothetical protein
VLEADQLGLGRRRRAPGHERERFVPERVEPAAHDPPPVAVAERPEQSRHRPLHAASLAPREPVGQPAERARCLVGHNRRADAIDRFHEHRADEQIEMLAGGRQPARPLDRDAVHDAAATDRRT